MSGDATFAGATGGLYFVEATLIDDRGCHRQFDVANIPTDTVDAHSSSFRQSYKLKRRVASAELSITHGQTVDGEFVNPTVFSDTKTVDAKIHPPAYASHPCGKSAKPSADQLVAGMGLKELARTLIVGSGYNCARVINVYQDYAKQGNVDCVKYASGRGRASYKIDVDARTVEPND